jgi:hypothetical protein
MLTTEYQLLNLLLELDYEGFWIAIITAHSYWGIHLSDPDSLWVTNIAVLDFLSKESRFASLFQKPVTTQSISGKAGYEFLQEIINDYIEEQVIFLPGYPLRVDLKDRNRIQSDPLPKPRNPEELKRIGQLIGSAALGLSIIEGAKLLADLAIRWFATCDRRVLMGQFQDEFEAIGNGLRSIIGDRWT